MERIDEEQDIDVYIDGSCINNGKMNAKAGYGVFFTHDDIRNESNVVEGKQTNNTGELTAMIRALEILKKEIEDKRIINIYTDSEYVMKCSGSYGEKLAKNNWKTKEDKIPPNLKLLQKIYDLYHANKKHINIHHIKAHTGLSDEHSMGNAEADRLANLAVGVIVSVSVPDCIDNTLISNIKETTKYDKHYINIKIEFKDSVKKLGAKWDLSCKKWYYEDNVADANKKEILEIETKSLNSVPSDTGGIDDNIHKKIFVKIPFTNKDAVKKLGCRWEPEKKSWYYMSNLEKNKIDSIKKLEV